MKHIATFDNDDWGYADYLAKGKKLSFCTGGLKNFFGFNPQTIEFDSQPFNGAKEIKLEQRDNGGFRTKYGYIVPFVADILKDMGIKRRVFVKGRK